MAATGRGIHRGRGADTGCGGCDDHADRSHARRPARSARRDAGQFLGDGERADPVSPCEQRPGDDRGGNPGRRRHPPLQFERGAASAQFRAHAGREPTFVRRPCRCAVQCRIPQLARSADRTVQPPQAVRGNAYRGRRAFAPSPDDRPRPFQGDQRYLRACRRRRSADCRRRYDPRLGCHSRG